jgi:hypothetical protein
MNKMLSEHFSLQEFTQTSRPEFQVENRIVSDVQIQTLTDLAATMETVRGVLSAGFGKDVPIIVHSAYRCPELNTAIGSVPTSQHPLCQACDFVPGGVDLVEAFNLLWAQVAGGELAVGQLIHETAERSYGATSWIHASLGSPWRDLQKCQQVLRMENGTYTLLGKP